MLIPAGAIIHGRIRRLEQSEAEGVFVVGLEFTEIEAYGQTLPFYADLLRLDKSAPITPALSQRIYVRHADGDESITLRELPGVASFFVRGKTFTIPAGFGTVWRTRGPIRGLIQ